MENINEINAENFDQMFNIKDIISNSVFYPAAGIDGSAIECLSKEFNSFVHVDYSTPREVVEPSMRGHFSVVGYDLVGIKYVSREELTPNGFQPFNFELNEHERRRLGFDFIRDRFNCIGFTPFALWAVYELNPLRAENSSGKAKRFSLLHIGGEACATFEAIYLSNKINPGAVGIISPGEGYGDNWTKFRDPDFRLYQNMWYNHQINNAPMPKILMTNMALSDQEPCFWPQYNFQSRCFANSWQRIYKIN